MDASKLNFGQAKEINSIHQSGVLIFCDKSVFFSSQSPKLTNFTNLLRIPEIGRIN